jgi:peptide deformylase
MYICKRKHTYITYTQEVALVNPVIVATSEGTDVEAEGCLSFPGMQGDVRRHKWIKVEAQDEKGKKIKRKVVSHVCMYVYTYHAYLDTRNED